MALKDVLLDILERVRGLLAWLLGLLLNHLPFFRKGAPKGGEEDDLGLEPPKGDAGLEGLDLEEPGLGEPSLEEPGLEEPGLEGFGPEEGGLGEPDAEKGSGFGTEKGRAPAWPAAAAPQPAPVESGMGEAHFENIRLGMKNIEERIENLNRRFDTLGSSIDLVASQGEFDKSLLQRHEQVLKELNEKADLLQKQHQAMWDKLKEEKR